MKLYHLIRKEDVSGISGTGKVAEVAEFQDGTCVMHWLTELKSTTIFQDKGVLIRIHGHEGRTELVEIKEAA